MRRRRNWASRPGSPGGEPLFSNEHFGVKQRCPLRKSFSPSRRQSLQTGPVYLAIESCVPSVGSDAAFLGRAATVVRDGSHVADRSHLDPRALDGADGRLAAGPGPLDEDVDLLQAQVRSRLELLLA